MIGDKNPTGGVTAAVMMIITCPLVFISLQRTLTYINTNSDNNSNSSDYTYRLNDAIERVSQYVHGNIWRCILSILMMKDMVCKDTNSNSNTSTNSNSNSNDDRESRMTETISRLSAQQRIQ
jgi:hypothetical protein